MSTPLASRMAPSSTVVAVPIRTVPCPFNRSTHSEGSTPKVKLNTGTRSSSTTEICSSKDSRYLPGSGEAGRHISLRNRSNRLCAFSIRSRSSSKGSGMNRLTAKGRSVRSRTARIASRIRSGDMYPAPRVPRPPASETAATSSGVVVPPGHPRLHNRITDAQQLRHPGRQQQNPSH